MTASPWDLIDDAATPAHLRVVGPAWLPNGFFTLVTPDGSHRTFRIRTEQNGAFRGKRTLALLIGPVNTSDYETQGEVTDAGFKLWRRFERSKSAEYASLIWDLARGEQIEGYELHVSKRCQLCNRPLTHPEALERGIGPECWERLHGRR